MARQQVALVLQLGCDRVVCLAHGLSPELLELQHLVEARGAQFHVIGQARALVGLVSAVDEVIVLSDGLFASTGAAATVLEEGQAVLVQPIEPGLAAGFERVDLNHAFGGAMRLPGRLVERIAELPVDCDAASALLRIALQAGVRQKLIPPAGTGGRFWTLVRSEEEAHALEPQWIRHRTRGEGALSLSGAIALLAVRSFGPALLHAGSGARVLVYAAAALALMAFGAGWFGLVPLGLGLAALAWVLRECAAMLTRIESDAAAPPRRVDTRALFGWTLDAILIALVAWHGPALIGGQWGNRLFAPVMLLALLRIVPRLLPARLTPWFEDRAVVALVLGGAMLAGFGTGVVQLFAVLLALVGILVPIGQSRLTRS